MKKQILTSIIVFVLSVSCNKQNLELERERKLALDLCLNPDNGKAIKMHDYVKEPATIRYETESHWQPFYCIVLEGQDKNLYYDCKIPESFKKDGLKVLVSGASYDILCKANHPCGARANIPFLISKIALHRDNQL